MIINLTQYCTLRCPHCMQNAGPERSEMMDEETFVKAARFATDIGSRMILLSGGEPTSHPKFLDFLKMLIENDLVSILVLSNGTFLKDYAFVERFAKMVSKRSGFGLQISSFKGLYTNYDEVYKPNLKALRLFGEKAIVRDKPGDIQMRPLGRACSGKWYDEAKRKNYFPSCTNAALILTQVLRQIEPMSGLDDIGVGQILEFRQRFCAPMVSWDGSIRLGESEQCKVVANVSEPLSVINQKIKDFRPCGGCDSYKWHFTNPRTEKELMVAEMLGLSKHNKNQY